MFYKAEQAIQTAKESLCGSVLGPLGISGPLEGSGSGPKSLSESQKCS